VLGIGIGFVIASIIMISSPDPKISETELIKLAKERGMVFPDEVKVLYDKK